MTTVINQAFLLNDMTMVDLKKLTQSLRVKVEAIALSRYETFINHLAEKENLGATLDERKVKAVSLWMKRREKIDYENYNDPFVDISFELLFVPIENKGTKFLLGFVFTKQREMYEELLKIEGVKEYFFDNRGDRPEGVSDKEWMFREEIANHITDEILSEQGFSIELISKKKVFQNF